MNQKRKLKQVQSTSKKIEESLSYTVEVRDKEGRVLQRVSAPSRSYVEQFNQIINKQVAGAARYVRDTGGVERSLAPDGSFMNVNAPIGNTDFGLRVGKGTTAVAIDDYALGSPLDEGTGTDEVNHQVVTFIEPSVAGSTCSFTVKRIFVNNSGATISGIKEIGCYMQTVSGINYYALGFRDVLPSAVYVPHGGSITVTYTIPVTV